ncbi:hypothetical protein PHYSODRAFT_527734, partial [Phytophthora sojae]
KVSKLKEWRDNPKWTAKVAAKQLGVAKGALMGWKKALWHLLDDPAALEALGDAFRKKGAGKKKRLKPYDVAPQLLAYKTSPLQSNSLDCGVYMLHYMHKVARFISEKRPDSVAEKMKSLTSGSFNVTKAGRSRSALLEALQKDKVAVTVIE